MTNNKIEVQYLKPILVSHNDGILHTVAYNVNVVRSNKDMWLEAIPMNTNKGVRRVADNEHLLRILLENDLKTYCLQNSVVRHR